MGPAARAVLPQELMVMALHDWEIFFPLSCDTMCSKSGSLRWKFYPPLDFGS
jgi:hypothetical protein